MIDLINLWFVRAVPKPTPRNFDVQMGCHLEEVHEMLMATKGTDSKSEHALMAVEQALKVYADGLKSGEFSNVVHDRLEFLDALPDQIVTATGLGHMQGMDVVEATKRTNESNWSKFVDGQPVFNEHGKIAKGPNYKKVDLIDCY